MKVIWLLPFCLLLTGCMANDGLFPLKQGNTWVYEAVTPIGKNVRTVKVVGNSPVGTYNGFELTSESGATDMTWANGELLASKLSGTAFNPPLIMYKESAGKNPWSWTGKMRSPSGLVDASAAGIAVVEDRLVNGQKVKTTQVTLTVTAPGQKTEIMSWYLRGVGLVAQEQRDSGVLQTKLVYVSGP